MVRWDFPNVEIAVKNEICFNFIIRIIEENLTGRTSFFLLLIQIFFYHRKAN